jgi:HK97 family phage major capsid protein
MNFPALKEAEGKLEAKRSELAAIFAEAQDGGEGTIDLSKVKEFAGDTSAAAAKIKALNDELTELGKAAESLRDVQRAAKASKDDPEAVESGDDRPTVRAPKSLGELFVKSSAFKNWRQRAEADLDVSPLAIMNPQNTLFETGAGWAPESARSGLVVLDAQRPVQVTDLLPQIPTSQSAYKYMEETTFTNNAAEAAEGGTYGEAALVLTERSVTVEKVTVWLPVTDEQLEDEPGAEAYVNARLPFMLRQRLDSQILVGDGNTPNVLGINNKGSVGTQAKGSDPVPDAVHKGITKARVTGRASPNAVIFHDNDWQDVRLLRTADGIYIWGSPSEAGPERIWGLRVVKSDAQTENTAVVGDFANYSLLVLRRGIRVQVSDSHSDYFIKGKQAIRADLRAAVVWTRPEAFTLVSGI